MTVQPVENVEVEAEVESPLQAQVEELLGEPESKYDPPEADEAPELLEPAATADDEAAESAFPEYLLEAAGITAGEAESQFGTPEALGAAVRMLDSRFLQAGALLVGQQGAPPLQPPTPLQQVQPPQQVTIEGDDDFELPPMSGDEVWDDDTKALVQALNKKYKSELSKRDEQLLQHQQTLQSLLQEKHMDAQQRYVDEFDEFVNELGREYKALLGEGSGYELKRESIAMQNRVHLDSIAAQYAAGRRAHGQPDLPLKSLFSRSLKLAFPDADTQATRREVVDQVGARQRMVTQRPSQRRTSKMTGEEKAIAHANELMRARGMPVPEDDFDYSII
jgi:hypothetical protein